MIQHTKYINARKQQALFVLSRIENENKRKLVRADYWIEEYQSPQTLYCLPHSADKYGIEDSELIGRFNGTNCFFRVKASK